MSGQPAPTIITVPFATQALTADINVVPVAPPVTPNLACYQNGFPHQDRLPVSAGGTPPAMQDFNGVFFDITSNIAANQAGQYFPYNSTIATAINGYAVGAILAMANGAGLWINTVDANSANPDTANPATSGWVPLATSHLAPISGLTNANITLTAVQAASDQIFFSGTLTGNIIVTFPPWQQNWYVNNDTTPGAFTITCKTAAGAGVIIPLGGTYLLGDGTNIGFATLSKGSFTGVYQGVTAALSLPFPFVRNGSQVTISLGAMSSVASNSTGFSVLGIPAYLLPIGAAQYCPIAIAQDNSATVTGAFATPFSNSGTPTLGFGYNGILAAWTASGNKRALGSITYDLYAGL